MPIAFGGTAPQVKVEIAFVSNPYSNTLVWTDVTQYVDEVQTTRGRNYELGKTEAGTADVTLRNLDGRFDPTNASSPYYPYVLPYRPLRITASWLGTSYGIWYGFVERWPQKWAMGGNYGTVSITAVDGFKTVLARVFGLRYFEQVVADGTNTYTRYSDYAAGTTVTTSLRWLNSGSNGTGTPYYETQAVLNDANASLSITAPLVGADQSITWTAGGSGANKPAGSGNAVATYLIYSGISGGVYPGSTGGSSQEAFEMWWKPASIPTNGSVMCIAGSNYDTTHNPPGYGPAAGWNLEVHFDAGGPTYYLREYSDVAYPYGTGTTYGPFPGVAPSAGRPDHIVVNMTIGGGNPSHCTYDVYVNGAFVVTYVGGLSTNHTAPTAIFPYYSSIPAGFAATVDEVAYYRAKLTAAQILNHYTFKSFVGDFPQQTSGARIAGALDSVLWPSTMRSIDTGLSTLQATGSLTGTAALDAIQTAAEAELGDVFIDGQGRFIFQDRSRRNSASPVATFGENSTETPYQGDLTIEFDDQYIYNSVQVTQAGSSPTYVGIQQDTTSQGVYGLRVLTRSEPLANTSDIDGMAATLLAWYKDPRPRVPQLSLEGRSNPDVFQHQLGREIGDLVTVKRRPMGASTLSINCFIDGVKHSITPTSWVTTFMLTPQLPNSTY